MEVGDRFGEATQYAVVAVHLRPANFVAALSIHEEHAAEQDGNGKPDRYLRDEFSGGAIWKKAEQAGRENADAERTDEACW